MKVCEKCKGIGWYQVDDMHSTICNRCCDHAKGWWDVLTEFYQGYQKGGDNRCCVKGCGTMFRDLNKNESGEVTE